MGQRRLRSSAAGFALVLVGVVGFFVGCFLPYSVGFLPGERTLSFFRLMVTRRSGLADLAGYVNLFIPAAIVAVTAAVALARPRRWTVPGVLSASTVWAISWLGALLSVVGLVGPLRYGSWFMIASVVVVVTGAILIALSAGRAAAVEVGSGSEPVPAVRA